MQRTCAELLNLSRTIGVSPISSVELSLMPRLLLITETVLFSNVAGAAEHESVLPLVLGVAVHFWCRRSRKRGKLAEPAYGD